MVLSKSHGWRAQETTNRMVMGQEVHPLFGPQTKVQGGLALGQIFRVVGAEEVGVPIPLVFHQTHERIGQGFGVVADKRSEGQAIAVFVQLDSGRR